MPKPQASTWGEKNENTSWTLVLKFISEFLVRAKARMEWMSRVELTPH